MKASSAFLQGSVNGFSASFFGFRQLEKGSGFCFDFSIGVVEVAELRERPVLW